MRPAESWHQHALLEVGTPAEAVMLLGKLGLLAFTWALFTQTPVPSRLLCLIRLNVGLTALQTECTSSWQWCSPMQRAHSALGASALQQCKACSGICGALQRVQGTALASKFKALPHNLKDLQNTLLTYWCQTPGRTPSKALWSPCFDGSELFWQNKGRQVVLML